MQKQYFYFCVPNKHSINVNIVLMSKKFYVGIMWENLPSNRTALF